MNTEHQKPEAGGSPVDCQVRPCLAYAMELERHVSGDRYSETGRVALDGLMAEIERLRTALRIAREGYASEAATGLPVLPQWRERTVALIDAALGA